MDPGKDTWWHWGRLPAAVGGLVNPPGAGGVRLARGLGLAGRARHAWRVKGTGARWPDATPLRCVANYERKLGRWAEGDGCGYELRTARRALQSI